MKASLWQLPIVSTVFKALWKEGGGEMVSVQIFWNTSINTMKVAAIYKEVSMWNIQYQIKDVMTGCHFSFRLKGLSWIF